MYAKWHELQHMEGFMNDRVAVRCSSKEIEKKFIEYIQQTQNVRLNLAEYLNGNCVSIGEFNGDKTLYNCTTILFHEEFDYIIVEYGE